MSQTIKLPAVKKGRHASDVELVKRASPEFQRIQAFLEKNVNRSGRFRSVKLFSVKPYQALGEKELINTTSANGKIIYDLTFESLLQLLKDKRKKLFKEKAGFYFFKSSSRSRYIEQPFQIKRKIKGSSV
jgi:hypothetical protein